MNKPRYGRPKGLKVISLARRLSPTKVPISAPPPVRRPHPKVGSPRKKQ